MLVALALPALVGITGASAAVGAAAPEPTTVGMVSFTFDPATVTIPAGSTVTWTYDETASDIPPGCESPVFRLVDAVSCPGHSTTAAGLGPDGKPLWDSGVHRADGFPYSHTFTEPGTYAYYCTVHGGPTPNNPLTTMNGTIVVTGAPAAAVAGASGSTAPTTTAAGGSRGLPDTGGTGSFALGVAALVSGLAALGLRRRTSS